MLNKTKVICLLYLWNPHGTHDCTLLIICRLRKKNVTNHIIKEFNEFYVNILFELKGFWIN